MQIPQQLCRGRPQTQSAWSVPGSGSEASELLAQRSLVSRRWQRSERDRFGTSTDATSEARSTSSPACSGLPRRENQIGTFFSSASSANIVATELSEEPRPCWPRLRLASYGKPACGVSTVAISTLPFGAAAASCSREVGAVIMKSVFPSSPPSMHAKQFWLVATTSSTSPPSA